MLENLPENWQVTWGSSTDVVFVCQGETRCSIMRDFVYCLNFVYTTVLTPTCRAGKLIDRQGTAEGCQWEVHREVIEGCREGKHKLMGFDSSSLQQEKEPPPTHSPAAWLQHPWWENEPTICCPGLTCVLLRLCLSRCPGLSPSWDGAAQNFWCSHCSKKTPKNFRMTT